MGRASILIANRSTCSYNVRYLAGPWFPGQQTRKGRVMAGESELAAKGGQCTAMHSSAQPCTAMHNGGAPEETKPCRARKRLGTLEPRQLAAARWMLEGESTARVARR